MLIVANLKISIYIIIYQMCLSTLNLVNHLISKVHLIIHVKIDKKTCLIFKLNNFVIININSIAVS